MKVKLLCKEQSRQQLIQSLAEHDIAIDEQANLILSERGMYHNEFISGKENETITVINRSEISYFEAFGNDVYCVTSEGKYKVESKLYELEHKLFAHAFIRVSKSSLVNIMKIEEIIPWIGSKYILRMVTGHEVDVTRTYYKSFKASLGL